MSDDIRSPSASWISGWRGRKRPNGNYYPNSRLVRLTRALGISDDEADAILEDYWTNVFKAETEEFVLDANDFDICIGGTEGAKFYRCKKCGRVTPYNVKKHCASVKCAGMLEPCDPLKDSAMNHYARLYSSSHSEPLYIKEHTEFAKMVPKDCVILTLACGKYRFNKLDFGEVAGLPRLLDVGQCNDVYSAIRIATGLADAFGTDVNGLPLSLIISWYEQKAVADLLALLSLGIKGIYLGPTLPAFLSPNVLQYLVDTFDLRLITNAEDDIKTCLKQNI